MSEAEILIIAVLALLAFCLGGLLQRQRSATEASRIAMAAAIFAVSEARAVKNSTVINRIIERHHIKERESLGPEAQDMADEFEDAIRYAVDPTYRPDTDTEALRAKLDSDDPEQPFDPRRYGFPKVEPQ